MSMIPENVNQVKALQALIKVWKQNRLQLELLSNKEDVTEPYLFGLIISEL